MTAKYNHGERVVVLGAEVGSVEEVILEEGVDTPKYKVRLVEGREVVVHEPEVKLLLED